VHYNRSHEIDDLTTALSYETIVEICSKHLGINEDLLLDKKRYKYYYAQLIFMGVLYLYSNVENRVMGKKIGRHGRTIYAASQFLCHYFNEKFPHYTSELRPTVEKILIECEQESNGRVSQNVKATIFSYDGHLEISEVENKSIFDVDEISTIEIKDSKWFRENVNYMNLTAVSNSGDYQANINIKKWEHCDYLYQMQFLGYRFLAWYEYSAMCLDASSKINARTAQRLRDIIDGNSDEEKERKELEMYRMPKKPGKISVATEQLN
jgi:hypothetical protein